MSMRVVSLRRYPVKSMGGELLESVPVDTRGLVGDRWYAVEDGDGRFASGKNTRRFRRYDPIFDYWAVTLPEGGVECRRGTTRWLVGDPALDAELSHALHTAVRVLPEVDVPHQDMGPISVIGTATLQWCADRWGIHADPRRLRVNIVFTSDEPFIEETWSGREVVVGDTTLHVVQRVPRCRMVDVDQDGATAAGGWLKPLAQEREMFLAMYADVSATGSISVGDELLVR